MAERDFGQVETAQFEPNNDMRPSSNMKTVVITLLATVFAIACFAVGFYMGEEHGLETIKGNKHDELVEKLQAQQQELNILKKEAEVWQQQEANTSQIGELTFYNELPEQSIVPEPLNPEATPKVDFLEALAAKAAQKDTPSIDHKHGDIAATEKKLEEIIQEQMQKSSRMFRIQVASFKAKQDADKFIPKLLGIGVPAEVQRVELNNIGVRYRVYTKPYQQEQQAMQAKQLIKEKLKITGIMVQHG